MISTVFAPSRFYLCFRKFSKSMWPALHLFSYVIIESFRFYDEYDNEYKVFSILRSARAWTSVILAGKSVSRRHSATSFSEKVVVAETSYQMLEVLSFCDRERVQPPSLMVTVLTFLVKNGKMKLSGESIFWEYAKKLEVKSRTRSRPRPEI